MALLALVAAAGVLLAWRSLRGEARPRRRAALVALRALAALLAVFLLLEPAVQLLQTARVRHRFAVLLDASRSMRFPLEAGGPSRAEALAAFVREHRADWERLAERVDVEWYGLAGEATPTDAGAARRGLPPAGGRTDLLGALQAAAAGSGASRRLAGVLLLSDGADNAALTEGLTPAARADLKALGAPVNTVAFGREAPRDLAVERIAVDDFAFVRNTVTVEVTLRATGLGAEAFPLVLRREGAVVAQAPVKLEPGKDRYVVPLAFAPDATGTFVFTVAAPVLPGEAVAENNQRSFVLRVIRDRVRVLLVAGRPSWDERFLRGLLKQDPNVDLVSFYILRTNTDTPGPQEQLSLIPFPVQEIFGPQLKTFDAVVLVNFAYAPYRSLDIERYLPGLRDYVKAGGGLAMVGGEQSFGEGRYGATPLAEILPVVPLDGAGLAEEPIRPRLTAEGRRHPITALGAGEAASAAAWEKLPAVESLNRTRALGAADGAAVLLEAPGVLVEGRPAPVVAVREVGGGRSLAVATDGSWRWGFLAAEAGGGDRAYRKFWGAALRWLVRDPDLTPLKVEPDQPAVEPGAPVGLTITVRGADYAPAPGRRVAAELVAEDGRTVARGEAVSGADGTARVELVPPGPGAYKVVARGDAAPGTPGSAAAPAGGGPAFRAATVRMLSSSLSSGMSSSRPSDHSGEPEETTREAPASASRKWRRSAGYAGSSGR
ncbi:MAG TPA: glutamine amidotransferase [Anaeromyxobacteraceae bacterium]|nr:glutamine amidotransferase [Anaeromyxobacteraceae bacterium]